MSTIKSDKPFRYDAMISKTVLASPLVASNTGMLSVNTIVVGKESNLLAGIS